MKVHKSYIYHNYSHILWLALILLMCLECGRQPETAKLPLATTFTITGFEALTNWHETIGSDKNQKLIFLDYYNAINTGFVIPSVRQSADGAFYFRFAIKNNSATAKNYAYKILYRNDTYKYPELDSLTNKEHQYACENFYGSYEHTDIAFKHTPIITPGSEGTLITDTLRIVGNPRNEQRYFENGHNDRWKRNPRVGSYSFMLVVCEKEDEALIPSSIKNIGLKEKNQFKNPFYYFMYGAGEHLKNTAVVLAPQILKVVAKPDLGAGLYLSENEFPGVEKNNFYCNNCGYDTSLYLRAPFRQMVHAVESSTSLENIPVVYDVVGDNYTLMDYNWNRSFYTREEMVKINIESAHEPCKTVLSDSVNHKIVIRNPASKYGEWRKERVGIVGRHGMTYGKYRFKCKMTQLLSADGIWNGMTNAIWMIFPHGANEWNDRRICNKEGYMATYWGGYDDKKIPYSGYSEIDFEILKTVPYCPDCDFPPTYKNNIYNIRSMDDWNVALPDDLTKHKSDITVACTNWDMACPEPENYGVGCKKISYNGQDFYSHRWQKNYRALTQKSYQSDDELFGSPFYYFEIDWQPTQIIWRIGPTADKMRIVGYMNDKVTMIANNQMVPIITQEWHNTKWWPGTPFEQGNIPFPAKDLVGEIFELVIE